MVSPYLRRRLRSLDEAQRDAEQQQKNRTADDTTGQAVDGDGDDRRQRKLAAGNLVKEAAA